MQRTCSDCMIPPVVNNLKHPETGFHYIENGKYIFIPNDGVPPPSFDEVKRLLVQRFGFRVVAPSPDQLFDHGSTSMERAWVYSDLIHYFAAEEFDSYPQTTTEGKAYFRYWREMRKSLHGQ